MSVFEVVRKSGKSAEVVARYTDVKVARRIAAQMQRLAHYETVDGRCSPWPKRSYEWREKTGGVRGMAVHGSVVISAQCPACNHTAIESVSINFDAKPGVWNCPDCGRATEILY